MEHNVTCETLAAQIGMRRAGRRQRVAHGGTLCSGCYAEPPRPRQRYGKKCHAAYERARRDTIAAESIP